MTMTLSNSAVEAVIRGGPKVDRSARIAELGKLLEKVKKDIAEQERLEKRWQLVYSAFTKLKREMFQTLTPEEREAMDGAYIFLHSGCVDLVRQIPSDTSKGEEQRLEKDLSTAEAMRELKTLGK